MIKESIHPKQSSDWQVIRETGPATNDSTRSMQRNVVQISTANAIDTLGLFHRPLLNIEPYESPEASMEYATGRARVYDCLKAFGAGCILGGKRDINVQHSGMSGSTAVERKRLVG